MQQISIPDIIEIADMSISLAGNYQERGNLFEKRRAYTAAETIAVVADAVRWKYDGDPTNTTLRGTANYLYWLCGKFGLEAQFILDGISGGGGSVTPVTPGGTPDPLEFVVTRNDETGTVMFRGQSQLLVPQFVGYNLLFIRNNIPQSILDLGNGTSFYSWDKTTGLFTCNPAAYDDELFQLYPFV